MNNAHRKRMQPSDYLYHLLNQGDDTESAKTETHQKALNLREQYSVSFDIALIAETQALNCPRLISPKASPVSTGIVFLLTD